MDTENTNREGSTEETGTATQENENKASEEKTSVDASDSQSSKEAPAKDENAPSFNKEALLSDLHKERSVRKELKTKVEDLSKELDQVKPILQEHESLKTKYNRLESFLIAHGGDISRALDSRSFTEKLFNSEDPVEDLVAEWRKANPSSTSSALTNSGSEAGGVSFNDLLRAASK